METLELIKRRALQITAELEAKCGPYAAEIVPGCNPQWHVVTTAPGGEERVLRHLSDRGFGVYLPRFDRTMGQLLRGPIFPRHVFLFVWDVLHHWRRVRECPGVTAILAKDERPVVMPDRDIGQIQLMEFEGLGALRPKKRARAGWRKQRAACDDAALDVMITSKSYWSGVARLDPDARISALHQALGLSPCRQP